MLVSVISLLAAASAVSAQSSTVTPAPQVTSNPAGAKYVAMLPEKEGSALSGSIEGTTGADGKGVKFAVSFSGLPEMGGPFIYHIHAKPVPEDGNCTATGAHQDPYMRGEATPCDPSMPETCQTGDLSGKHGSVDAMSFSAEYTDAYLSTDPSDPAFFGDLSFVIHLANKTRIGCANFAMVDMDHSPPSYGTVSTTSSSDMAHPSVMPPHNATVSTTATATIGLPVMPSSSTTTGLPVFSGAAVKVAGSAGAGALLAAALVL
ncbi:hypothetical protein BDW02DRAFT_30529 [Decorospora gaudefroyi]|uniref:superoxide dismutase n=1 Tax=Decorospora gaudefroyi TaxID=184978 RepID=A0A6A5K4C9_9PLEO|nr:hypothetical protein BDW02DRAFT_30529 [Decorospora gaudefroyi]